MKKLLLIALVVTGLAFVPVQRSDAQVSVGIGGIGVLNHILTPITRAPTTRAPRTTGTTGIGFTATTVIITTDIGTKLA